MSTRSHSKRYGTMLSIAILMGMSIVLSSCCGHGSWGCRHHRDRFCAMPITPGASVVATSPNGQTSPGALPS
jgi:hypothetical protein